MELGLVVGFRGSLGDYWATDMFSFGSSDTFGDGVENS